MVCLADWAIEGAGEGCWRHGAPPLMALHDPSPPQRCQDTRHLRFELSRATGRREPVLAQAARPLPGVLRQAKAAGFGYASRPRPALTPAGLALAPDGG